MILNFGETMSTATMIAKSMVGKIDRLRENKKVCVFCDAVQMFTYMSLPIAIPFIIMYLSMQNYYSF
jgi:hypothetical protein|tara:strand:- start:1371 stop:1571 length:201 start_codon:yes stop_codon:yes gene_type:complete